MILKVYYIFLKFHGIKLKNPKELLTIGEEINVEVIELNIEKKIKSIFKNLQEKTHLQNLLTNIKLVM